MLQNLNIAIDNAGFAGTFTFVPVVDETFILERPITLNKKHYSGVSSWPLSPID